MQCTIGLAMSKSIKRAKREAERNFMIEVINVYKTLPSLWKVKSAEYHNRQKKNEDYYKLLKKYREYFTQGTLDEMKRKINALRTNFRSEIRKMEQSSESGAGNDDIYESRAWFLNAMMFLHEQETSAQSRTSIQHMRDAEWEQDQEVIEDGDVDLDESAASGGIKTEETDASFAFATSLPMRTPTNSEPHAKRRKPNQNTETAKAKLSELDDRYLSRAKTWAHELRHLDARQELFATKAINDILFEARCGNLLKDSVKINENSTQTAGHCSTP